MSKVLSLLPVLMFAAFCSAGLASAQSLRTGVDGVQLPPAHSAVQSIDLTRILTGGAAGQAALAEYHRRKELGLGPAGKRSGLEAVGSRQGFQVFNWERQAYDEIQFTLKVETPRFNIWVEDAELDNGRMDDTKLEALRVALQDETPAASFDPAKGVVDLDEIVFGTPTDVDGSGKSDILVLDIRDGFDPNTGGSSIQGFVDPSNLSSVNVRDILHLDTFPSLAAGQNVNNLYLTAAHEYQHLIRFAYDPGELTFVDEGMSEWAEVMTGFGPRRNIYWSLNAELRRPLLGWRGNLDPAVDFDYQRAGLLTNYIAQRIGVLATGAITRSGASGASGYAVALAAQGFDLETVLADFHVTNTVNDASVNPIYSQGFWFPTVSASPAVTIDGTALTTVSVATDGGTGSPAPLEPGAAVYHSWQDVSDFTLSLDALPGSATMQTMRSRLRAFLVADAPGSGTSVTEVTAGGEPTTLSGDYSEVTLVVAHVDASLPGGFNSSWARFTYDADWTAGSIGASTTTTTYEDGNIVVIDEGPPTVLDAFPFGPLARVANKFEIPGGSVLAGLQVANLYADVFDTSLSGTARDYTINVHSQDALTLGPGPVILEVERTDTSPSFSGLPLLDFDDIDLTSFNSDLSGLTDTLFVSISNAGTDQNTLVWPLAEYAGSDTPTWLFVEFQNGFQWAPFRTITLSGEFRFRDRVSPIRAKFAFVTADEDQPEIPSVVSLAPNYPNPFNPRTSIVFQMPVTGPTRLAVYDMLGREVAVLVDGVTAAGRHEVTFDAGRLASGLYLYALEAGDTRLTRTMVLLK
jgi:hypothetical protein